MGSKGTSDGPPGGAATLLTVSNGSSGRAAFLCRCGVSLAVQQPAHTEGALSPGGVLSPAPNWVAGRNPAGEWHRCAPERSQQPRAPWLQPVLCRLQPQPVTGYFFLSGGGGSFPSCSLCLALPALRGTNRRIWVRSEISFELGASTFSFS